MGEILQMKSSLRFLVEIEVEHLKTALNQLHHLLVSIYDTELVGISADQCTVVLGWTFHIAYKDTLDSV